MENNSFYFNLLRCRNFSILMINEITVVEKFLPPRIFLYNEFCKGLFSIYFGLKNNCFWYNTKKNKKNRHISFGNTAARELLLL